MLLSIRWLWLFLVKLFIIFLIAKRLLVNLLLDCLLFDRIYRVIVLSHLSRIYQSFLMFLANILNSFKIFQFIFKLILWNFNRSLAIVRRQLQRTFAGNSGCRWLRWTTSRSGDTVVVRFVVMNVDLFLVGHVGGMWWRWWWMLLMKVLLLLLIVVLPGQIIEGGGSCQESGRRWGDQSSECAMFASH